MGSNNEWTECFVTGIHGDSTSNQVVVEQIGRSIRCNRSHLKPCGFDFLHISERYLQLVQNLVPSGEISNTEEPVSEENLVLSAPDADPDEVGWISTQNSVLPGPPLNFERDTDIRLISDAPSERVTFANNPVQNSQFIPMRLRHPLPPPAFNPWDPDLLFPVIAWNHGEPRGSW